MAQENAETRDSAAAFSLVAFSSGEPLHNP
jgi:hypothetical protein